jgi:ABC-2 type transport system permease protein
MGVSKVNKKKSLVNLVSGLLLIILVNYVGFYMFDRYDLTSEKRYSLSNATKDLVAELDDVVFVRIYLDGDLPAGLENLRNATKETLDELRAYSNDMIEYEFINPSEDPDEKVRTDIYRNLTKKGLQYTNIELRKGDKYSEQIIFPGAIFSYKDTEVPLQLLKSQLGASPEQMLNVSIQQLEYEISSSIKKLTRPKRHKIAFIEGHAELEEIEVADITQTLNEFYTVERIYLDGKLNSIKDFDAIVIAKPDSSFSEKDKFIIDQFIMNGGRALWFLDNVFASMDSLRRTSTTMGIPVSNNLEDMLFKYGVRINTNLLLDLQALPIPVVTGYTGNQPKQEFFPWHYFPLIASTSNHPIVNNLDLIKTEFVSSIDTVGGKGITKTVLLATSEKSKALMTPVRISLNILRDPVDKRQYNKGNLPVAVLLEGEFNSVFKNRVPPGITNSKEIQFKGKSSPTKQIIVSDGDVIKNFVNYEKEIYYPLGYDKYTERQYGNKDFILNAVNYLCDDNGLIDARSKEFKIRLLDPEVLDNESAKWQTINIVTPILLILLLGLIQLLWRKKRYN